MDLHSGAPYWLLKAGLRSVTPPLSHNATCDVVIIGSGVTGAMMASRLSRAGANVIVLDRRDLATGSTMASTALLMYELDVPLHKLCRVVGVTHAQTAYRSGLHAIRLIRKAAKSVGVACEPVPSVLFATSQTAWDELHVEFKARQNADLNVKLLGSRELRSRWGVHAHGAVESRDAAVIDPFAFAHALLRDAVEQGAVVHDRTSVVSTRTSNNIHTLKLSTGATVRANHVVHATGYEAASHLPAGLVDLSSSYAMITEPLRTSAKLPRAILWQRADPYFYARVADDRLLVGGEDEDFTNAAKRDALVIPKAAALTRKIRRFLPELAASSSFAPAFAWAGTFGTTPDGVGYIGEIASKPRQYYALGFGGNGITFAALGSAIISDLILGTSTTTHAQRNTFSFSRRQRIYAK